MPKYHRSKRHGHHTSQLFRNHPRRAVFSSAVLLLVIALAIPNIVSASSEIVDPFAVLAAFDRAAEMNLWPGFEATEYPVAIYDGERTLLLRHPDPPPEFEPLPGHDGVYFAAGKHPAMRWNSNADIGGTRTATLLLTIEPGRSVEYEAHILFHEVFHLFSKSLHPSWRPNEMWRYSYPMGDLENYRQLLLEERALARAVESKTLRETASWAARALDIRTHRQAELKEEHRFYETVLELQEGTAVYMGRSTIGTASETERLLEDRGPEGIRWRCYETGAAVAVILDRLLPTWKKKLDERPDTTFADLLGEAVNGADATPATFSDDELAEATSRAATAVAGLAADRAELYENFEGRGTKVVVRLADDNEVFEFARFDPMAVEVLENGETLQAHLLTTSHPRGELEFSNPHFVRRSLDGVIAMTTPAGDHPFLFGYRQISVTGFSDAPTVERRGSSVAVTAQGLELSFDGATVRSTEDSILVTVLAADQPQ